MKHKITALALGLLLLAVPSFAQYGGGGYQGFTVPTLTVNPGPLTVAGTFSITGDFTLDTGAQLLLDDGTEAAPGLAFDSDVDTGIFHEAINEINFSSAGSEIFEARFATPNTLFQFLNVSDSTNIVSLTGNAGENTLAIGSLGGGGNGYQFKNNGTISQALIGNSAEPANVHLMGAANFLAFDVAGALTDYIKLTPGTPSGITTITLPPLTGTALVGGAANTHTGTTSIDSDVAMTLSSDGNIFVNADLDVSGVGDLTLSGEGVTITADVDSSGNGDVNIGGPSVILLDADDGAGEQAALSLSTAGSGVQFISDTGGGGPYTVSVPVGVDGTVMINGTSNNTFGTSTIIQGDDGGTSNYSGLVVDAAATVSLDGDIDNSGNGTATVEAANSASQVVVNATGVSVTNYLFPESLAQAALGTPANGAMVFCSDCDPASTPCTAAGAQTGSFAYRVNGQWDCP